MAADMKSKLGYLNINTTLFMLCDLQEKVRLVVKHFAAIVKNTQKLLKAGKILGIELIVSEQYADKSGETIQELDISHAIKVYQKLTFSMASEMGESGNKIDNKSLLSDIDKYWPEKTDFVLFGFEAHVCIELTAMDLIAAGYNVHIVADCTSSRSDEDRKLAFERLKQIGCFITTSENIIFKLLQHEKHPKYDEICELTLSVTEDTNLA